MDGTVALVALVMVVGAVGTVVPLVPGLGLCWAAALGYGLAEGFGAAGAGLFAAITVVALAGTLAGWVVPHRAATGSGAHRRSVWLGLVGAVAGFFLVPVVGLPLGGVAGIYVGEHLRTHDAAQAWRATRATIVGFGVASLVQFAAALLMIALWAAWVVAG